MAQIFVSHSKDDKDLVDFFSKAVKGTKVKAVFEEFERSHTGEITTHKIIQDVNELFSYANKIEGRLCLIERCPECDVYHKKWDADGYEDCEREIKAEIMPDGVNDIG